MGARNPNQRDLTEELARVRRRIDQAVFQLTQARARMTTPTDVDLNLQAVPRESELATMCISLELSLADAVAWAERLADRLSGAKTLQAAGH